MRSSFLLLVSLSLFSLNTLAEEHSKTEQVRPPSPDVSFEHRGSLSKQKSDNGQQKIIFFPDSKVSGIEYSIQGFAENWTPLLKNENSDPVSYYSNAYTLTDAGRVFLIRFINEEGNRETVAFTIGEDGKTVTIGEPSEEKGDFKKAPAPKPDPETASGQKVDPGSLDMNTINNGAPWVDPQTLAQARADYMAANNLRGHLGTGFVMTSQGRLSEGTGWGQGMMPSTCIAKNGSAAVADAHATGPGGIHRVRLYDCPSGTYRAGGNGGGGGGLLRRRGRRR